MYLDIFILCASPPDKELIPLDKSKYPNPISFKGSNLLMSSLLISTAVTSVIVLINAIKSGICRFNTSAILILLTKQDLILGFNLDPSHLGHGILDTI